MKFFALLLLLCLCDTDVSGKRPGKPPKRKLYTIHFDKSGKLVPDAGLASAHPRQSTIVLDIGNVKKTASTYFTSLSALTTAMQSQTGTADPVTDCLCQSLKPLTPDIITAITSNTANLYLISDTTRPYLPLKVADSPNNLRVSVGTTSGNSAYTLTTGDKPVDYQLIRENYDNQILANQLANSIQHYKGWSPSSGKLIDSLNQVFDAHAPRLNTLFFQDSLRQDVCTGCQLTLGFQIGVVNELVLFYKAFSRVNVLYNKVLCDNREWIRRWLWYTGGVPKLNPFPVYDTAPALKELAEKIQVTEKGLALLQTYSTCCGTNRPDYEPTIAAIIILMKQLNVLTTEQQRLAALVKPFSEWVSARSIASTVLYKGAIPATDPLTPDGPNLISWQHHYDAADKFNYLTKKTDLPDMVADLDQVIVLVHNVKAGDTISLKASEKPFTPKTKLQTGLEPITKALSIALLGSADIAGLTGVLSSAFRKKNALLAGNPNFIIPTDNSVTISDIYEKGQLKRFTEKLRLRAAGRYVDYVEFILGTTEYDSRDGDISDIEDIIAAHRGVIFPNLIITVAKLKTANRAEFVQILYQDLKIKDEVDYFKLLIEYATSTQRMNWFRNQTTPVRSLDLEPSETPAYQTIVEYPEKTLDSTTSKTVTYNLLVNAAKDAVVTRSYNKFERIRWWPTLGIAYIPRNRSAAVYNDTTMQFSSGTDFDNFEALVGVKYYLKKTNPTRDRASKRLIYKTFGASYNRVRGYDFLNTLFLTGGLGIRHKFLRNYYLGIGDDIKTGSWTQEQFYFPETIRTGKR